MSTTIQIKRSSTASAIPVTGDIAVGELAVNLADKRLFTKQSDGTIIELSTNPTDLDAATLRIDGVEITASATELNSLDGFTGSTTELNLLDGLTATTIELNTLDGITASTAELNKLDGYTGSTAELNILDGVTATTAEINTLDGFTGSASDLNYAKDLRATGVTTTEFDKLDGLTATTTELNILDGVTATTAELNITDGLTATTTELNTLDGITASTTELNYTDGVTSNIQTQLNGKATSAQGALADSAVQPDDNVSLGAVTADGLTVSNTGANIYLTSADTGQAKVFFGGASSDEKGSIRYSDNSDWMRFYTDSKLALELDGNGNVSFYEDTGTTTKMTWDASDESLDFGDNVKATFGTGNDLQIYHDGSNSYINNVGTGSLIIQDTDGNGDIYLRPKTGQTAIGIYNDNTVEIAHSGNVKLATTSTGVDVTGTLSADGLTVEDAGVIQLTKNTTSAGDSLGIIEFHDEDGSASSDAGKFQLQAFRGSDKDAPDFKLIGSDTSGVLRSRLQIANNGDVSFYEDSGTTAKMVWSSSAESLGIGGAPNRNLHVQASSNTDVHLTNDTTGHLATDGSTITASGSDLLINNRESANTRFLIGGSERMRIDSAGNVGIGTASPSAKLHSDVAGTADALVLSRDAGVNGELQIDFNGAKTNFNSLRDGYTFSFNGSEKARIDSSGNLLVGTTSTSWLTTIGHRVFNNGSTTSTVSGGTVASLNRLSTDGTIIDLRKDGATVGSIGTASSGDLYITDGRNAGIKFDGGNNQILPVTSTGAQLDNTLDLGKTDTRFKDLYLSGGVYLGGTGAVNKLDDYETGSWTPSLTFDVGGTGITTSGSGRYTKVGQNVTVWFSMAVGGTGGSGDFFARLNGIPFTGANLSQAVGRVWIQNPIRPEFNLSTEGGTTNLLIYATAGVDDFARGDDLVGQTISGSFTYRTDA